MSFFAHFPSFFQFAQAPLEVLRAVTYHTGVLLGPAEGQKRFVFGFRLLDEFFWTPIFGSPNALPRGGGIPIPLWVGPGRTPPLKEACTPF